MLRSRLREMVDVDLKTKVERTAELSFLVASEFGGICQVELRTQ